MSEVSKIQTLNQQRAEFALECVKRVLLLKEGKWVFLYAWEKDGLGGSKIQEEVELDSISLLMIEKNRKRFESFWKEVWDDWEKKKVDIEKRGRRDGKTEDQIKKEIDEMRRRVDTEGIKVLRITTQFDYTSDYSSHAKKLPQLIISNGLIPAMAFYKSKAKDRRQIYNDIELWLKFGANNRSGIISDKEKDLLEYLLEIDSSQLRLATMEALEFANWLKRICEIELKEGEKDESE